MLKGCSLCWQEIVKGDRPNGHLRVKAAHCLRPTLIHSDVFLYRIVTTCQCKVMTETTEASPLVGADEKVSQTLPMPLLMY